MKRIINIIKGQSPTVTLFKPIPSFKFKGVEKDNGEKKYNSEIEKPHPKGKKKEVNKDELKYFIHL